MSAMAPISDLTPTSTDVAEVPRADIGRLFRDVGEVPGRT